MFSATDPLPDDVPARLRPQPVGDSNFSDIEDDGNGDGSAFLSDGSHASAAVPTARRPYMNVVCGAKRDSVRLGRYDHTRRPYVGPGMLAAQIEERRAELVFSHSMYVAPRTGPACWRRFRDDDTNRGRDGGRRRATRSGPCPNSRHRHGRDCAV